MIPNPMHHQLLSTAILSTMLAFASHTHAEVANELWNLTAKAATGDATAQLGLAVRYRDGEGVMLGFEYARVVAVWKKFRDSGKYKSVLTSPGHLREHYGLTNLKEFFAEMTENYFGSNDFYPFVTGELKPAEPEIFALRADIWGKLPEPPQPKPEAKL